MLSLRTLVEELHVEEVIRVSMYECGHKQTRKVNMISIDSISISDAHSWKHEDNKIYMYYKVNDKCPTCILFEEDDDDDYCERIYCDEMPRPEGFESVKLYHGLAAFSGATNVQGAMNNAINLMEHSEYQICTATHAIGPIGLLIQGTVLMASNVDLGSRIDPKNNRRYVDFFADDYRLKGIVHHADQLKKELDSEGNNEVITTNNKVAAIWVYDWASNEFKDMAKELCNKYNLELIIL